MKDLNSFFDLFCNQVEELYSLELELIKALQPLVNTIKAYDLKKMIAHYHEEVRHHLHWFEKAFHEFTIDLTEIDTTSHPLLKDLIALLQDEEVSSLRDAAIIVELQKIIHAKISLYGTIRTFARHLNLNKSMDLFQRALNEETEKDRQLTKIAEGGMFTTGVNEEACMAT
jgi:ferritin-like metal-binding protein YciE